MPKTSINVDGDIIVADGAKRTRSKKPLLVGAIAIVIVIIIIAIIAILSMRASEPQISKIKQSFNKFANYMIYGEDSISDLTEAYQYGDQYYISHLSDDDAKKVFLASAQTKFQHFYDEYIKYAQSNESEDTDKENSDSEDVESDNEGVTNSDELLTILDTYRNDLGMALYTQSSPILSANEIMLYYLSNPDNAESEIRAYYNVSSDASNEVLAYATQNIQDANAVLSAYATFSESNCIIGGGRIDNSCLISAGANLANANQVIENYNAMFSVVSVENYDRSVRLYQNIWVIWEKLNEKN